MPPAVFRDDAGTPIPYGRRWRTVDGPPESAFSAVTHPERFAPLHTVADALVEHLMATYDVEVTADGAPGPDPRVTGEPRRIVHLRPARDHAAPLTIIWSDLPGVVVHAGLEHVETFPCCACDACDETVEDSADDLERLVLGVAAGTLREWVRRSWPGARTVLVGAADATSAGEGRRRIPRTDIRRLRGRLRALPDGRWQPWTRRDGDTAP
nr:DUF6226 family protein [Isoptericola sediminis]